MQLSSERSDCTAFRTIGDESASKMLASIIGFLRRMLYTRVRAKDLCTALTAVRVLPVQFVWIPVQTSDLTVSQILQSGNRVGRQKRASGQKSKKYRGLLR